MKTILELFGRYVIVLCNTVLLILGEPYIGQAVPIFEPYSIYIMFGGILILGLWATVPLLETLNGHNHTHQ